ncbi:MAG: hypothetical protein ACREJ2_18745 [Planctomycetota bacterium]
MFAGACLVARVADAPSAPRQSEADAAAIARFPELLRAGWAVAAGAGWSSLPAADLDAALAIVEDARHITPGPWAVRAASVRTVGAAPSPGGPRAKRARVVARACSGAAAEALSALPDLVSALRFAADSRQREAVYEVGRGPVAVLREAFWDHRVWPNAEAGKGQPWRAHWAD